MIGLIVFLVLVVIWLALSIRKVGPTERAVKVVFGKPVEALESGVYFDPLFPLPGCYLIKVSTKQYKVDIPAVEAYSREGEHRGKHYGSEPLTVCATLYLYFPKGPKLIDVVRAKIPTTEEGLVTHFGNAVQGVVRIVVGQFDWRTATEKIDKIREKANEVFKRSESILKGAGFDDEDFNLVIERIELPSWLKTALSQPDQERLRAEAAKNIARGRAIKTVRGILEKMSEATGQPIEELRNQINKSPRLKKEFRELSKELTVREVSIDGESFIHIHADGVQGLDKTILQAIALFKNLSFEGRPREEGKEEKKCSSTDFSVAELEVK